MLMTHLHWINKINLVVYRLLLLSQTLLIFVEIHTWDCFMNYSAAYLFIIYVML